MRAFFDGLIEKALWALWVIGPLVLLRWLFG